MTIAALIGAKSFENSKECVKEFEKCIRFISQDTFVNVSKRNMSFCFLKESLEVRHGVKDDYE